MASTSTTSTTSTTPTIKPITLQEYKEIVTQLWNPTDQSTKKTTHATRKQKRRLVKKHLVKANKVNATPMQQMTLSPEGTALFDAIKFVSVEHTEQIDASNWVLDSDDYDSDEYDPDFKYVPEPKTQDELKEDYLIAWYRFAKKFGSSDVFATFLNNLTNRRDEILTDAILLMGVPHDDVAKFYSKNITQLRCYDTPIAQLIIDSEFGRWKMQDSQLNPWLTETFLQDPYLANILIEEYLRLWSSYARVARGNRYHTGCTFGNFFERYVEKYGYEHVVKIDNVLENAVLYGTFDLVKTLLDNNVRFRQIIPYSLLSMSNIHVKKLRFIITSLKIYENQDDMNRIFNELLTSIEYYNRGKLNEHNDRLLKLLLFMGAEISTETAWSQRSNLLVSDQMSSINEFAKIVKKSVATEVYTSEAATELEVATEVISSSLEQDRQRVLSGEARLLVYFGNTDYSVVTDN
jgi:hypothetical protein